MRGTEFQIGHSALIAKSWLMLDAVLTRTREEKVCFTCSGMFLSG